MGPKALKAFARAKVFAHPFIIDPSSERLSTKEKELREPRITALKRWIMFRWSRKIHSFTALVTVFLFLFPMSLTLEVPLWSLWLEDKNRCVLDLCGHNVLIYALLPYFPLLKEYQNRPPNMGNMSFLSCTSLFRNVWILDSMLWAILLDPSTPTIQSSAYLT